MKKRVIALVLVLIFALSIAAYAAEERVSDKALNITFNGEVAHCSLTITDPGAEIDATLELYEGNLRLMRWTDGGEGTGYISMGGRYSVISGRSYTLKAYGTIDGVYFEEYTSGTC